MDPAMVVLLIGLAVIMVAVLVVGRNPGGRRPPPGTRPRRRTRGSLSGQAERERAFEVQAEVEAHDIDQMLAARDALRQRMGRPSIADELAEEARREPAPGDE